MFFVHKIHSETIYQLCTDTIYIWKDICKVSWRYLLSFNSHYVKTPIRVSKTTKKIPFRLYESSKNIWMACTFTYLGEQINGQFNKILGKCPLPDFPSPRIFWWLYDGTWLNISGKYFRLRFLVVRWYNAVNLDVSYHCQVGVTRAGELLNSCINEWKINFPVKVKFIKTVITLKRLYDKFTKTEKMVPSKKQGNTMTLPWPLCVQICRKWHLFETRYLTQI